MSLRDTCSLAALGRLSSLNVKRPALRTFEPRKRERFVCLLKPLARLAMALSTSQLSDTLTWSHVCTCNMYVCLRVSCADDSKKGPRILAKRCLHIVTRAICVRIVLYCGSQTHTFSVSRTHKHTHSLALSPSFPGPLSDTHTNAHTLSHILTHTHIYIRTNTQAHSHTLTHIQTLVHTNSHTQKHTIITHKYMWTNTYKHMRNLSVGAPSCVCDHVDDWVAVGCSVLQYVAVCPQMWNRSAWALSCVDRSCRNVVYMSLFLSLSFSTVHRILWACCSVAVRRS